MSTSNGTENNAGLGLSTKTEYQELFDNIHQFGCVSFTLLLARDVGILDTLLEAKKQMTSQEIADRRNLKERYTREILDCLVTVKLFKASVVKEGVRAYYLDESARAILSNPINNANIVMPLVLTECYDNVKKCVDLKGPAGVPYGEEAYKLVDDFDKLDTVSIILKYVPELKSRMEKGIKVLELGSGRGLLTASLAKQYPKSTFTASEWNSDLEKALTERLRHLPNANAVVADLNNLPTNPSEKYDWILIKNASHISPHPGESTKRIRRMVTEPNGIFTYIDFLGLDDPLKSMGNMNEAATYVFSIFCCLPLGYVQSADSEAFGCCWDKARAIKIGEEANFRIETFDISRDQSLFVARPI